MRSHGHGRLGRVETGLLSRTLPIGIKGADRSTQARRAVSLCFFEPHLHRVLLAEIFLQLHLPRNKDHSSPFVHPRLHLRCERCIHAKNLILRQRMSNVGSVPMAPNPRAPTRDWRQPGAFHSYSRILNSSLMLIQRNEAPHSHGTICEIVSGFITEFFRCPGIQNPDADEYAD